PLKPLRLSEGSARPNPLLFCSRGAKVRGMAAPLPLPALYATHAGIWLVGGRGEVRDASRGEAIARAAETPNVILNAPLVGARLEPPERGERMLFSRLKQWEEAAERPVPRPVRVDPIAARAKLDRLTGRAETREGQKAMAAAVTSIFAAKRVKDAPNL